MAIGEQPGAAGFPQKAAPGIYALVTRDKCTELARSERKRGRSPIVNQVMGERNLPSVSATAGGRDELVQNMMAARRMSLQEAMRWCDAWENRAANRGVRSDTPYFWDSARGWIDAQLAFDPTEIRRAVVRRLGAVANERRRVKPGSRRYKALLREEEQLKDRLTTSSGLPEVVDGRRMVTLGESSSEKGSPPA
jgi:hypothetical protein